MDNSTIPDEIKQKIAAKYPFIDRMSEEDDYVRTWNTVVDGINQRRDDAIFGYSLASQRIQELEKEVERLQKMNNELMSKLSVQAD